MENTGHIEIHIEGKNGNLELKPDNYDISELIPILVDAEILLNPDKNKKRPLITYEIQEGTVKHVLKTSMQRVVMFNALLAAVSNAGNIDFLDSRIGMAFERLQNMALKKNYTLDISTSIDKKNIIKITPQTHYFFRKENLWVNAEFYFYGKITNAGGKDNANIHLSTSDLGTLYIQTPIDFLEQYENNLLYKTMGIYAVGMQNVETGEIDTTSLKFQELVTYVPKYDEEYLSGLREKAMQNWLSNINTNDWLNEIRGRA